MCLSSVNWNSLIVPRETNSNTSVFNVLDTICLTDTSLDHAMFTHRQQTVRLNIHDFYHLFPIQRTGITRMSSYHVLCVAG